MRIHKSEINNLLLWFKDHKRDLPWRIEDPNRDPYRVWVSEVMLQQTQVTTVIPYFIRWMNTFPNVKSLARAKEEDVIANWAGLGYYSRARNLQKGAQFIEANFKGEIPFNVNQLLKIPGIGEYTAGAISSLAFEKNAPILDGNLIRIFSRFYNSTAKFWDASGKKVFWEYSSSWIKNQKAKLINEALMELGALVCRPRSPNCIECPLVKSCLAYENKNADSFPVKRVKAEKLVLNVDLIFLKYKDYVYRDKGIAHLLMNEWMPLNCDSSVFDTLNDKLKNDIKEFWSSNDLRITNSITHHKLRVRFSYIKLKSLPSFLNKLGTENWVLEKDFKWTSSLVGKCLKKIEGI